MKRLKMDAGVAIQSALDEQRTLDSWRMYVEWRLPKLSERFDRMKHWRPLLEVLRRFAESEDKTRRFRRGKYGGT